MDTQLMKKFYNNCDPYKSLEPDDPLNLDIDATGDAAHRVRGKNWVDRIAKKIEFASSETPVLCLFTGLPGTGKSTELKRLDKRLRSNVGIRLLPVYINAEEYVDLANTIGISDVLATLVYRVEEDILKAEGDSASKPMQEGYLARFSNWLALTDVTVKQLSVGDKPTNLVLEMKTRPSFREQVRSIVEGRLTTFLSLVRDSLLDLNQRAIKCGFAGGICVIFDSLEKIRGVSNWESVLKSCEVIFRDGAPYLRLPVHVIYTVPPALYTSQGEIEFMPVIRVFNRNGEDYAPGIETMEKLVYSRLPLEIMEQLFGVKYKERLVDLIKWSGGYTRELLIMLRNAFLADTLPLSDSEFKRIRNEVWDGYRAAVYISDYQWLARTAVVKDLQWDDEASRQTVERLLLRNAVLRYLNEDSWFDLHPAVRNIPGVAKAIEKEKLANLST